MLFIIHIDKINDDNDAYIAQAYLRSDDLSSLNISVKYDLVEIVVTDKSASVDVDGGHRFGLIDGQVTTRL